MKKSILLALLATSMALTPSSGQITMRKEEDKAAKKDQKREQKNKKKQEHADHRKNKRLEKKINNDIKKGRSDIPN